MRFEGTLKSWEDERGFGFIQPDQGGEEVFVHIKSMVNRDGRPKIGQRLTFEIELGPQGKKRATGVLPYQAPKRIQPSPTNKRSRQLEAPAQWGLAASLAIPSFAALAITVAFLWGVPLVVLAAYLGASVITMFAYAFDKAAAVRGDWRAPESTLHFLALVGGWPGALLAQQLLRHKSSKVEFRLVFWATVVINVAAFVYLLSPHGRSLWSR